MFEPSPDLAKVRSAAVAACIADEIEQLPLQYEAQIGGISAALSAGQKQRLLLARAFYRRPEVLILDEGTANLDEETERRIGHYISSLDITRIVIAHRPTLVSMAHRVLTIDGTTSGGSIRAAAAVVRSIG